MTPLTIIQVGAPFVLLVGGFILGLTAIFFEMYSVTSNSLKIN